MKKYIQNIKGFFAKPKVKYSFKVGEIAKVSWDNSQWEIYEIGTWRGMAFASLRIEGKYATIGTFEWIDKLIQL